jgi:hypothetical protein
MPRQGVGDKPQSRGPDRVADEQDEGVVAEVSDSYTVAKIRWQCLLHGDGEVLQPLQVLEKGRQFGSRREIDSQAFGGRHRNRPGNRESKQGNA